MSTREEIEAAVERFEGTGGFACSFIEECEDDLFILSQAYIADRQQHERDQQPPTREMFERLDISDYCGTLEWDEDHRFPRFYADGWFVEIPTVARLRAACLLLGIETEGVL